ncbi:MAG: thiamine-monophosphate kinase [Pseudomonadota bacterium]|nr:thiamine-monophosphate kinase [Pseudomonadota bacterium]MDQ5914181.1 thiamine-monophosphate kinase [Pseudomonadota bacterium]MDQ5942398.1 thiamine-monophosphate kinase [Pseudomonadota bacterium]MDQ5945983.1 thiamine-monophosphate kinase [Pseudomonadota bacterium]
MASEFELISRHFSRATPSAILGPGDDCALVAPAPGMELALTTDMLVEGTHFLPDTDPGQLGWKTLAVNLSDLAAMGATPRWVLLAGALPNADEAWIAAFADGFFRCAKRYGAEVIGGDTTRGPRNLCVTAIGELPAGSALRRDGARLDDDIWVSGQPGLAALGLAHLQGKTTLPEALARRCVMALQRPLPRIELGLRLRGIATSAIDVSDGLLADLGHILERSGLAADLFEGQFPLIPPGSVPRLAREAQLGGGDDYELCFTTPIAARQQVVMLAAELDLPLWRIGYTVSAATESGRPIADIRLIDADGQPLPIPKKGFDHFD